MPPVACPGIFVYNPNMSSSNIIKIVIALGVGIALGLLYGWMIDPVEYTDAPPNILREDYKVDYVLMVAEAYQTEMNDDNAARRLGVLGSEAPAVIITDALEYAKQNNFTEDEIQALQDLLTAMQTYQPQGNVNP